MRSGKRFGLSAAEKSDIWNRWKTGQSLHEIGRAFDKPHTSIRHLLLPRGGIPPRGRRRSRLSLTLSEREDISRGICPRHGHPPHGLDMPDGHRGGLLPGLPSKPLDSVVEQSHEAVNRNRSLEIYLLAQTG